MASIPPEVSAEDRALLDRLATRIVELRLEAPAILTLESARPLSLLASQGMVAFEPLVQALFRAGEYRRWSALVGRRECLALLTELIEARVALRRSPPSEARKAP